jgi:HPt (histidine-containing phosphotransfer) domain-containing protein
LVDPAVDAAVETAAPRDLAIEGIDTDQGLRLLRGDRAKYARLLGTFASYHRVDIDVLRHPVGRDREVARRLHALEGSASAIGAATLHRQASMLAARLRDGVDVRLLAAELAELSDALQRLVERIGPTAP